MNEISTSAAQYYRRSWKAPMLGLLLMGVAGFVGIPILAAVYGLLETFIPFVIVRILLVMGYAFAAGFILAHAAKIGKVRNLPLIACAGVFFGLFAEYAGWLAWLATFLREPRVLWLFFFPLDVFYIISQIAEVGSLSFRGTVPTGGALYLVWLIEAAIVVGGVAYMTYASYSDLPFCEESDAWAEKSSNIGYFAPVKHPSKFKAALEQTGYATFNQLAPAQSDNLYSLVQLYECAECRNFLVLNVKNVTVKLDNKGNRQYMYTPVVSNLLVTPSAVSMIRGLVVQYTK